MTVSAEEYPGLLREVYGQHVCDASKVITDAQLNDDGSPINDCLGHPNGSLVDNIEDLDTVVGWLSEFTRPHGFAISEIQFHVFILNASRRLFSDRFFTSSFRAGANTGARKKYFSRIPGKCQSRQIDCKLTALQGQRIFGADWHLHNLS